MSRTTGDRHRLTSSGLPVVLDMEEPPTHRAADGTGRRARTHSDHVADQPALGRSADSRGVAEIGCGIDVYQTTVAKYMLHPRQPPSQTWRPFLANHIAQITSADF